MRFLFSPIVIFCGLALIITNPTVPRFSAWAKEQIASATKDEPLVRLLAYALGDAMIQSTTQRDDYLFFSVFKTGLNGKDELTTIGVANFFVPLPRQIRPWTPGSPSQDYPHVRAADNENSWKPEDGYVWVRQPPNGDLRVRWQVGRRSEAMPHLVAAAAEGRWLPEDGYAWNINPPPPGQLGVHWVPGTPSSYHENIIAASSEERWQPAPGYRFIADPPQPGDFRVELVKFVMPELPNPARSPVSDPLPSDDESVSPSWTSPPQKMLVTKRMIACGGPQDSPRFRKTLEQALPAWLSTTSVAPGCETLLPGEILILDEQQTDSDTDIVVKLWRQNCVEHCAPFLSPLYAPPRLTVGAYLKPVESDQNPTPDRLSGRCRPELSAQTELLFGQRCHP